MKQTIVTFLLLFTGMAQAQTTVPEMPQKDFSALPTGLVKDVIDGDTVILEIEGKTEKVRLFGIDTPETKYPDKPSEHYGQMASLFSRNLLMGEEVWVEEEAKGPKRDRYNRRVLYLYRQFGNHSPGVWRDIPGRAVPIRRFIQTLRESRPNSGKRHVGKDSREGDGFECRHEET